MKISWKWQISILKLRFSSLKLWFSTLNLRFSIFKLRFLNLNLRFLTLLKHYKKLHDMIHNASGMSMINFCLECFKNMYNWEEQCLLKLYNHSYFWDWKINIVSFHECCYWQLNYWVGQMGNMYCFWLWQGFHSIVNYHSGKITTIMLFSEYGSTYKILNNFCVLENLQRRHYLEFCETSQIPRKDHHYCHFCTIL